MLHYMTMKLYQKFPVLGLKTFDSFRFFGYNLKNRGGKDEQEK